MMEKYEADYTNTFRALASSNRPHTALFLSNEWKEWEQAWQKRLERQGTTFEQVQPMMNRSNPAVIPRNHRVEEALAAAVNDGDYRVMHKLLEVLATPYELSQENQHYAEPPKKDCGPYQTFCGT